MAKEQNKLSKREKRKLLITRIVCSILALLMVVSVAYYAVIFFAS